MFEKYKNIIIIVAVIIVVFVAYSLLKSNPEFVSTIQRSSPQKVSNYSFEIISQLNQIQKIKLDTGIFNDPVFKILQDYGRDIQPENPGRNNPFEPIGGYVFENVNISTQNSTTTILNTSTVSRQGITTER